MSDTVQAASYLLGVVMMMSPAKDIQTAEASIYDNQSSYVQQVSIPDFAQYKKVRTKKREFFDFVHSLVDQVNRGIMLDRYRLISIQKKAHAVSELALDDLKWLANLSAGYKINDDLGSDKFWVEALERVDIIPVAMALAQAANESAWGTSRFALEGNNLFGQWCYRKGCGMVPEKRDAGARHEVAKFSSPLNSVRSYAMNINTSKAYKNVRKIRAKQRAQKQMPDGWSAAAGLTKYSQRGAAYVNEIRSMIRYNKLVELYQCKSKEACDLSEVI